MNNENNKAQMKKGVLEYCILLILARRDCYANEIINELKESKMLVVEGTLYPLLTRLKNAGQLAYRWEESTQGPPRKYYSITSHGQEFLAELNLSWQELVDSVALLQTKPNKN
jgi:PadR family transcriptional regulator, regulatory protein PadR